VSPAEHDRPFKAAARAYFAYGVVYLIGGLYLVAHGVGVRGSKTAAGIEWFTIGLAILLVIPYLLNRPRGWFERWILSRQDFARIVAALMAVRAWKVLRVAVRPDTAEIAAPWGGTLTFRAGAVVFFVVTVVALVFVARAAWGHRNDPWGHRNDPWSR
jgi:hypothetical protein